MKMELTIEQIAMLVLVGVMAGILSGFVGVGGGIIIVPAMIYLLNVNQMQAQGISLAVLMMPVGILGVINYSKGGYINFNYAFVIAAGFFVGSYFGSKFALKLPVNTVKFVFGLLLLFIAAQMLWKSGRAFFLTR
jgi:uncharacterized membrane protein YfcA